jgi:magnesium-protoporphyrin IX monomethyl ester (oxidative) cyclase
LPKFRKRYTAAENTLKEDGYVGSEREMQIKKCLLFIPPVITKKKSGDINPMPPLGLGYIAAILERLDIEVRIVDCLIDGWKNREEIGSNLIKIGLSGEDIKKIIEDFSPDMVGVNNLFTRLYKNAHEIYRIVKNVDHDIITVAGGAHPTVMPGFSLQDANLDFVVIGEGELTIEKLVKSLSENVNEIKNIDGLGYRNKDGKIIVNPKTTYIENLDGIPFPAWHLMKMEKYFGLVDSHGKRKYKRFSPIMTSRGCPARCTFCTAYKVWGRRYRFRSPENVIEEMKELKYKYGIEELLIEDDNFTANPKRAEKICDLMIKENLNFKWDTPNGVAAFALNKNLVRKMKDAGCYKINIGVESGNQQTLNKIIKKPLNLEKAEEIINYCREIGIDCGIFLILGMPGDTIKNMWDSYKFAKKVKIYNPFISIATPYPGSELYETCVEKKYLSRNFKLEDLYIRSFVIQTKDWKPEQIKLLMLRGLIYLNTHQALNNPLLFTKLFIKWLSRVFSGKTSLSPLGF